MKTRTAILASIFCVFTLRSAAQKLSDAQLFHALNEQLTEVIVTDGFSPPAAARIYAYTNMAGYEILVPSYPSYISLANQVTDYKGFELKRLANVDEQYLLVLVYTGVAKDFVYRTHLLDHFTQSYIRDRTDLRK
jgi:hypothetical protein